MSEPSLKLPRGAEELLLGLPLVEPDYDAQARAIEARLAAQLTGVDTNDLLQAPALASEPGEPTFASTARTATPSPGGLAELARKSVQRKADDDSAALAKELMLASSHARRPDPEMVARVRAAGKSAATATPLPGEEPASGTRRGIMLGGLGAALAIAACVALYFGNASRAQPAAADAALALESAANVPVAAAPKPALPSEPAALAVNGTDAVLTPEGLPAAPELNVGQAKPSAAKATAPDAAVAVASKSPAVGGGAKREGAPSADKPSSATATPERAPEPPPEPQMKPAEGNSGSVPLSPSGGAVSTALGTVRSGAQACLAGQNESVVAVVTFASDGHVASVTAAG